MKNKLLFAIVTLLGFILPVCFATAQGVVAKKADEVVPIMVSQKIPDVDLQDINGKVFSLRKAVKEKPALLIFYRGGWCPYCNTHLAELRKIEQQLIDKGFQIIAISPDKPKDLRETMDKHKLGYTLASDSERSAIKAFGLAFETRKRGILPVPTAMLVNKKGEVTFSFVAPNFRVRIDNGIILAAAEAQLAK